MLLTQSKIAHRIIDNPLKYLMPAIAVLIVLRGYVSSVQLLFGPMLQDFIATDHGTFNYVLLSHTTCLLLLASFTCIYGSVVAFAVPKLSIKEL